MRVAFLYNRSADDPGLAAEDEFPERSPLVAALRLCGHEVTPIACSLNLAEARRELLAALPDVVFNRVESLGGSDAMMAAMTLLLDMMHIPYTGNSTPALVGTASKLAVKKRLVEAGLPTPGWISRDSAERVEDCGQRFILKSDLEHASFELDESSVCGPATVDEIRRLVAEREADTGRAYFAEEFIDGREFNISVMGEPPRILPPAEIDFSTFPAGKLRIVGHAAKWDAASFEYHNTERLFEFPAGDDRLLHELSQLTIACWRLFGLTGYARVDFRCDSQQGPWILEINTNPCISPDAGFAAALAHAGLSYETGLQLILDDAVNRNHPRAPAALCIDKVPSHV
jgi:D-alanine-D-alanine ligase